MNVDELIEKLLELKKEALKKQGTVNVGYLNQAGYFPLETLELKYAGNGIAEIELEASY